MHLAEARHLAIEEVEDRSNGSVKISCNKIDALGIPDSSMIRVYEQEKGGMKNARMRNDIGTR